jgi:uncharacterized protein involved in outer membrane biogenesis
MAVVAVLAYLASTRADLLLAGVGKGLGREVTAERIGFAFLGGAGVTLTGVTIADDPAMGAPEPFLAARTLEMRLRLLPLVHRQLVVDRVVIEQPVVNLVRDRTGRMNVDSLGKRPRDPAADEHAAGVGRGQGRPAFQLATLRLRHGTIRYQERTSGRAVELADLAVDARQPRFDAPVPLALRARLATQDLRLDHILSEGVLDLAREPPAYRGSLTAGPGAFGAIAVDRLTATMHAAPPLVELESSTLETLGGTVTGAARLTSEPGNAALTARVQARGIDLERLPAEHGRTRPGGTLMLEGSLAAPPPGSPGFKTGATGNGRFEVTDGRIEGAGLGRPVLDAIQPFLRPGVADRLRERYPDFFASDDLRFTRLSGSGRLAGGRIRSDDFLLAAASWEGRGGGSLGLDGDLDATLRLSLSPALTDDILGESRARALLVDASGRLAIPLRARGPVRRPRVTPDPAFAGTAARALLGGTGLGEAAGSALERLLGGGKRKH